MEAGLGCSTERVGRQVEVRVEVVRPRGLPPSSQRSEQWELRFSEV